MLCPWLTLSKAEQVLGETRELAEWRFTENHPYVIGMKKVFAMKKEATRDHDIYEEPGNLFAGGIGAITSQGHAIALELCSILQEIYSVFNETEGWGAFLDNLRELSESNFSALLFDLFLRELSLNAIEHGSDWCTAGEVIMQTRGNAAGILATIRQPKAGPDFLSILRKVETGMAEKDFLRSQCGGYQVRGAGTGLMISERWPWIWGEPLEPSGFRTVILETRERLAGL